MLGYSALFQIPHQPKTHNSYLTKFTTSLCSLNNILLCYVLLHQSSASQIHAYSATIDKSRRWTFGVEVGTMLNFPYGDRCFDLEDVSGANPMNVNFTLLGLCSTPSVSWYVAGRYRLRLWHSMGLLGGPDYALRRERYVRRTSYGVLNEVMLMNVMHSEVEFPIYIDISKPRWSLALGCRPILLHRTKQILASADNPRSIGFDSGWIRTPMPLQPSIRASFRLMKSQRSDVKGILEVVNRTGFQSAAQYPWLDVQIGISIWTR